MQSPLSRSLPSTKEPLAHLHHPGSKPDEQPEQEGITRQLGGISSVPITSKAVPECRGVA